MRGAAVRSAAAVAFGLCMMCGAASNVFAQVRDVFRSPKAASESTFTKIADIRELSDGRVLLIDSDDPRIVLLDGSLSQGTPVGRIGSGPGEYRLPNRLFALAGDTTALLERSFTTLLIITPDARIGGARQAQFQHVCSASGVRLSAPRHVDAQGWYYSVAEPVRVASGGWLEPADSAAIVRWNMACMQDTLGFLPNSLGPGSQVAGGLVIGGKSSGHAPFVPRTVWTVAPDGRLAIVRPLPYAVDFVDESLRHHDGVPISYDPLPVTDRIKQRWREQQQKPQFMDVVARGGSTSRVRLAPPPFREPSNWPRVLPPFVEDDAAMFGPGGLLWIARATGDETAIYDVIDQQGRLYAQFRLPPRCRIVGFGRDRVYVARTLDDDLERLERHVFPR